MHCKDTTRFRKIRLPHPFIFSEKWENSLLGHPCVKYVQKMKSPMYFLATFAALKQKQ
jgi:hypothetical protein